jgi:hypothetical protein
VPSAEQEQQRLKVVVREYVRFLKLVLKYHHDKTNPMLRKTTMRDPRLI